MFKALLMGGVNKQYEDFCQVGSDAVQCGGGTFSPLHGFSSFL
jgi:hypothetical protein